MDPLSTRQLDQAVPGRHVSWVRWGVTLAVLGYGIVAAAGLILRPGSTREILGETAVVAVGLVSLVLIARGRHVPAARLFLLAVWVELLSSVFFEGQLEASGSLVFPLLILGVGLFQGGVPTLWLAGLTSVAAPAAAVAGQRMLALDDVRAIDLHYTLVFAVVVMGTALLVHLALRTLSAVLESALRSERKFADLVNNAPDGILSLNSEGRVVSINPAAAQMLGCTEEQALGEALLALAPELCAGISGCPSSPPDHGKITAEVILIHHAGGTVAAEATTRPVRLADGREGVQVMLRDVSSRRSAEELATQLGGIVENALNEIYIFHAVSWKLLRANRGGRDNLGYVGEELRRLTISDVSPTLTPDTAREIMDRLSKGENAISVRGLHRRKDGSLYPVESQLQAGTLEGEPILVAFAVDVSGRELAEKEQRRLQSQLQHAQKMEAVGHLAGGVAHDFNNLLTVVGGYADLLMSHEDSETQELAKEIANAQERGASLTRQLLAFARKEVAQPRVLSLATVIRDMERILLRVLGERYVLRIETRGDGWITADVGQIEQVALNLIANAKDAMPEGGEITVSVEDPSRAASAHATLVSLTVTDSGVGMTEEVRNRIFQPFFTTKPRGKGTGLGLSTVHGIVTQNGGDLRVDSAPEEGTRIRIHWPQAVPVDVAEVSGAAPGRPEGGSETVLLVEDDEALRGLVVRILERAGYHVLVAESGGCALETSDGYEGPLDLLLTDIVMPGISGIDLAERLRERRPETPVLFMSGYLDEQLHGDGRMDPSSELLLKPFHGPELLDRVRARLGHTADSEAAPRR